MKQETNTLLIHFFFWSVLSAFRMEQLVRLPLSLFLLAVASPFWRVTRDLSARTRLSYPNSARPRLLSHCCWLAWLHRRLTHAAPARTGVSLGKWPPCQRAWDVLSKPRDWKIQQASGSTHSQAMSKEWSCIAVLLWLQSVPANIQVLEAKF